jgi:hypothetical protein
MLLRRRRRKEKKRKEKKRRKPKVASPFAEKRERGRSILVSLISLIVSATASGRELLWCTHTHVHTDKEDTANGQIGGGGRGTSAVAITTND